ncbi:carbohydrate-binding protein [soil metagenome]
MYRRDHVRRQAISTGTRRTAGLKILVCLLAVLLVVAAGDFPAFARVQAPTSTVEIAQGWRLESARNVTADGATISTLGFRDTDWHAVKQMPATVLEALQDDGTYPNVYFGTNLRDQVPQDLYEQDWWYRTTFTAPAGHSTYTMQFPGINYRAEVWLNGHLVADSEQIVGMYVSHDLDVTPWLRPGEPNTLAVKVTPEQAIQDVDGVELADSWYDWINWKYLGYQGPQKNPANGNSFPPDRNAGIWKPVYLKSSGSVTVGPATVNTELPLPNTDSARLTINAGVRNDSAQKLRGVLRATITRPGKPDIAVEQPVTLLPGEHRDVSFDPDTYTPLRVQHPDLWWPYTMGRPDLYDLTLEFRQYNHTVDTAHQRFGIRTVTQHRDQDTQFPELGTGGNFYLMVNGRDFLIRGATYTPDLLFKYDPQRETAILGYVKDLGLNMLRLEGKFPGDHLIETADELGIPLMYGWMCCNQWEKWPQWDAEDRQVAQDSMRSQVQAFGPHASAFIWANGSDGRPPPEVRGWYHDILAELHWQNAVVDTVSSINRDENGDVAWDGIQMAGPYSWRPPTYWFDGRYAATRGSSAEQGDNEHIPPLASLTKFIPADKLWPINDAWSFHAGSNTSNAQLAGIRTAIVRRYGSSGSAEEFARKAQLAHYESTRAQFEAFAANGWANHKMTIYWMLNNHWPSFFGNLFDYYLRPGGAYYGAKTGLRPLSVVFDSYATGDHSQAKVTVVNQTPQDASGLRVRVRTYDLAGRVRDDRTTDGIDVASGAATQALALPRIAVNSSVYFVRCELVDKAGTVVSENVYWQSKKRDDVGDPRNDAAFELKQASWADMTALNSMAKVPLDIRAERAAEDGHDAVTIKLSNPSQKVAFFERAEVLASRDGDEILPIEYSDNYVTVFPGETVQLKAVVPPGGGEPAWVRVSGYNTDPVVVPVDDATR